MNFREVLAAHTDIGPLAIDGPVRPQPDEAYHDLLAPEPYDEDEEQYFAQLPEYQQLATDYLNGLAGATRAMADGELKARHERLLNASASGMSTMVRYLSLLPDVYVVHRPEFPDMPEDLDAQTAELGRIAARSGGIPTELARQKMAVSGRIEGNLHLRGSLPGNPLARIEDSAWSFVLKESDEGLYVATHFDLQGQIKAVGDSFAHDVKHGRVAPQRQVGCLALQVGNEDYGTAFEAIWQHLVARATSEPRLFRQSLEHAQKLQLG